MVDDGSGLDNEHKIPVLAYDHSDAEDVRRCWSPANMHVMTKTANNEKQYKLLDAYIDQVPTEFWPKSWGGKVPTEAEREAFYAKCLAGTTQPVDEFEADAPLGAVVFPDSSTNAPLL